MNQPLLIPIKSYPNNFDIIRFVLAASVILCHSFAIYYGYEKFLHTEPFMVWSSQQISIGSVAVDLFFIISGFLIVKSFETSSGTFNYLTKRILRIYPGFIVAFLLSILIAGFIGSELAHNWEGYKLYFHYLYKKKELVRLFTLQDSYQKIFFKDSPEPGVNNSIWTIQFEFFCYLLVPLFAWLGFFKNKWCFLIAFIMMYLIFFLQLKGYIFPFKNWNNLFFGNPYFVPRFVMYFLAGACFYHFRTVIVRSNFLALFAFIALAISFFWIKCIDMVLPLAGSYFLFFLVFHPRIPFGGFAKYGDFSYGVYLYGWPVQALVFYFFKDYIHPYSFFFIALPIAVLMAFLSWHIVEKPLLKFKKTV